MKDLTLNSIDADFIKTDTSISDEFGDVKPDTSGDLTLGDIDADMLGLGSGGILQSGDSGVGELSLDDLGLGSGGIQQDNSGGGLTVDDINSDMEGLGSGGMQQDSGGGVLTIDDINGGGQPIDVAAKYEGMIVYDNTSWAIFLIENGMKRWYNGDAWAIEPRNGQQVEIPKRDLDRIPLGQNMPDKKVLVDDLLFDQLDLPKAQTLTCAEIKDWISGVIKTPAKLSPTDSKRKQAFFEELNKIAISDKCLPIVIKPNEEPKEEVMVELESMSCSDLQKEIDTLKNFLMTARLSQPNQFTERLDKALILKAKCDLVADQPKVEKTDMIGSNLKPIVIGLGVVVGILVLSKLLKD